MAQRGVCLSAAVVVNGPAWHLSVCGSVCRLAVTAFLTGRTSGFEPDLSVCGSVCRLAVTASLTGRTSGFEPERDVVRLRVLLPLQRHDHVLGAVKADRSRF